MPVDPSATVAATARIHPDATVGPRCVIGEYCVLEGDVTLGADCRLEPYVYIKRWTTMGDGNSISAGTVLGTDPLDKAFTGERSYLRIGHRNTIREHFTISRGTRPETVTHLGDDNYIMTSGHIAHDCRIGNHVVICSCALIAGYVDIGDRAFVSGGVVVHQHSKIGSLAMVGGNSRVNLDLPPYFLYSEFDARPLGVNLVGLKRAGFTPDDIARIRSAYRLLYRRGLKLAEAVAAIRRDLDHPITAALADFIEASKRGIARGRNS